MELAPIILFVYNRPKHTKKTLETLSKNQWANDSILYIYCDGAKPNATKQDLSNIQETRELLKKVTWAKEVHIIERDINFGLAKSIETGVSEIVNKYGKVIVLEDDIETSVGFLKYMNEALNLYEKEEQVMHISGFFPKVNKKMPSTFFYNVTSCWGWATWKRAWKYYTNDSKLLLDQLQIKGYDEYFFNGAQKDLLYQQLSHNNNGNLQTWAVKWHTAVYNANGFCLHPYPSLAKNIGHDQSGTNSGADNPYQHCSLTDYIQISKISIEKCIFAYKEVEKIYKESIINKLMPSYIKDKISTLLNKDQRNIYFEKRRLYKIPRYQKGASSLTNPSFSFVDAATFLHGYEEIFDNEIYKFTCNNPNPKIIDCGSNIGLSVVYFKNLFPNAHLQAFEPDTEIVKTLSENVNKFGFKHVEINNKAIWNTNDGIEFQMEGGFSGRIPKPGDVNNIVKVPTQRLRDLLDTKIDFLKMDIEGAEFEVLLDCKDRLSNISNIFIEYHSHSKEDQNLHQILQLLHDNHFRYHIHEAYTRRSPFVSKELMSGMDLQLNIYGINQNN